MRRGIVLGLLLAMLLRATVTPRLARWWCYDGRRAVEMKGRSYW